MGIFFNGGMKKRMLTNVKYYIFTFLKCNLKNLSMVSLEKSDYHTVAWRALPGEVQNGGKIRDRNFFLKLKNQMFSFFRDFICYLLTSEMQRYSNKF